MSKNKKIFGIIHYFDLIVLLVIISIAGLGVKFLFQEKDFEVESFNKNSEYEIELLFSGVRDVTYDNINIGDELFVSETNKKIGVVKSKEVKPHKITSIGESGDIIQADHPDKRDVYVIIKGSANKNGNNIVMGNKVIKIGLLMEMYNIKIESTPIIFGIEEIN